MDFLPTAVKILGLVILVFVGLPIIVIAGLSLYAFAGHALMKRFPWLRQRRGPEQMSEFTAVRARMRRLARPTLLLTPTKSPGFSKLGGEPELPAGSNRPHGQRAPRSFLAQIDLAEAQAGGAIDWLPAFGRLYAFHDDQRCGFADEVCVLHTQEPAPVPAISPPDPSAQPHFAERRVAFAQMTSLPSLDWLGVGLRELDVSDEELDELAELPDEAFGDELQHRIGGYPSEIQGTNMALACEHLARGLAFDPEAEVPAAILRAAKSWRLLLQIDSDPALGMNWGDGGRLYVFVRAQHARVGDFSRTVTISQGY